MSDSGLFRPPAAAGMIKEENYLDQAKGMAQLDNYNLDVAKKARSYYALQKEGLGAAAGDQGSLERLSAGDPALGHTVSSMLQIGAATTQQKLTTQRQAMSAMAQELGAIKDPTQRMAAAMSRISDAEQRQLIHPSIASYYRQQLTQNPDALQGMINAGLQASEMPGVQGQQEWAKLPAKVGEMGARRSMEPPVPTEIPDPRSPYGSRWENIPGNRLPGAMNPSSVYGQPPSMFPGLRPMVPGGGDEPPSSGGLPGVTRTPLGTPGPRSSLSPSAVPASYGGSTAPGGDADAAAGGELPARAYSSRLFGQESGNRDVPNAAGSSASGLGQFTRDTWIDQMQKHFPDQIQGMSEQQILALRSNGNLQHAATMTLAQDNAQALTAAGLPVNAATLAMSHKLGVGGAIRALQSDGNTSMANVLSAGKYGEQAVRQNPGWARQSVNGFVNSHYNAFGNRPVAGVSGPTRGAAVAPEPEATRAPVTPATSGRIFPATERSGSKLEIPGPIGSTPGTSFAPAPEPPPITGARTAAATGAPGAAKPYVGGDSIALGLIQSNKLPGKVTGHSDDPGAEDADAAGGRNPQQALDFIKAHPERFAGQDVVWSTGLMNSGGVVNAQRNLPLVEQQLDAIRATKPNSLAVAGVDQGDYAHLNPALAAIAEDKQAMFGGPLPTKNIHPGADGYKAYMNNVTKMLGEQQRSEAAPEAPAGETGSGGGADTVLYQNKGAIPAVQLAAAGGSPDTLNERPGGVGPIGLPIVEPIPSAEETTGTRTAESSPSSTYGGMPMVHPKQREMWDRSQSRIEKESEEYDKTASGANAGLVTVHQLRGILDGGYVTGLAADKRAAISTALATTAGIFGKTAKFADREAAMHDLFESVSKHMAFNMVTALGSREAQQIVAQVMNIKPSVFHSVAGNRAILASLEQVFQMQLDKQKFYHDWISDPNNYAKTNASAEFHKQNPWQVYASKSSPLQLPRSEDGTVSKKDMIPGVYYDMSDYKNHEDGDRSLWDGSSLKAAGKPDWMKAPAPARKR